MIAIIALLPVTSSGTVRLPASQAVESFRPIGDSRTWVFVAADSVLGSISSVITDKAAIDGTAGVVIEERLLLDYSWIGSPVQFDITNQRVVASDGTYLGDDMTLVIGGQQERLKLERTGEQLTGFFTRGGGEVAQTFPFKHDGFAIDDNFLDQYELYFAMRDITVGQNLDDTVFSPRSGMTVLLKGTVESFGEVQIHQGRRDSVFAIHLSRPQEQYLFFRPDKRLVRADFPLQRIFAFQEPTEQSTTTAPEVGRRARSRPTVSIGRVVDKAPLFPVYVAIAALALALFAGAHFRRRLSYFCFGLGLVAYLPMLVTQVPLQHYLVEAVFLPGMARGASVYLLALLPALGGGVMQEGVKFLAVLMVHRERRIGGRRLTVIGAFCGAGFGVFEACHVTSIMPGELDIALTLMERGVFILVHVACGVFLGWGLAKGHKYVAVMPVLAVTANTLCRYLPVFVQRGVVDVGALSIILIVVALATLSAALLLVRRLPPAGG